MTSRSHWWCALILLIATSGVAQQRPIYDPDDFVAPSQHKEPVFISRLVLAGAHGFIDDYRSLKGNATFLHLTNSLYYKHLQFDYKHTEPHADTPPVFRCDCQPPLYFPTPPPPNAAPNPPPPGSKDTLQIGWYRERKRGKAKPEDFEQVDREIEPGDFQPSYTLRHRLSYSRENTSVLLRSLTTGEVVGRRSGHEQTIGLDTDIHLPFRGRDFWGSLSYARTWSSGTIQNRSQQELVYTARPPGWSMGPVLGRATLTVGGVSNRGGTALNVVNPALEAFWHDRTTRVNVHLIWSPQSTNDGQNGWKTRSQIALVVDRELWVYFFH